MESPENIVRADFNPSGSARVAAIKGRAADLIAEVQLLGESREASIAITNIEQGAMWAVKAATKGV